MAWCDALPALQLPTQRKDNRHGYGGQNNSATEHGLVVLLQFVIPIESEALSCADERWIPKTAVAPSQTCLFFAAGARHQLPDRLFRALAAVQDCVHLLSYRHLDLVARSQSERCSRAANPFRNLPV